MYTNLPVCVRICPLSNQGLENAFPHVVHTQGSVCERMCILRAPRLLYSLGQCLQWNVALVMVLEVSVMVTTASGRAVQCVSWWRESDVGLLQVLPQWAHWKRSVGSGLGGSDVRQSSSSPLLEPDWELRSRGPGGNGMLGDAGVKVRGKALVVHIRMEGWVGTREVGKSSREKHCGTAA